GSCAAARPASSAASARAPAAASRAFMCARSRYPVAPDSAMKTYEIVELLGDGISAELSESVRAVAESLPFRVRFLPIDLSVESRARGGAALFDHAVAEMHRLRTAIKYPTVTDK